jgi:pimeloyl-ACP methyl ester carboxylesterase
VTAWLLVGCSTNGERIDRLASRGGLQKRVVVSEGHAVVVYEKQSTQSSADSQHRGRLLVFLEGDGSPWGSSGRQPAVDPTARNPLALRLLVQTDGPAIYVARPCYQQLNDSCSTDAWTSGRYSEAIVSSMLQVIEQESARFHHSEPLIIGYSGGGPLAVLIAERLAHVGGVITLGANLDIDAWAKHHRYLPLDHSLNPALSERAHPWPEVHIVGGKDAVVPTATVDTYFEHYSSAQRITIDEADHTCCWEAQWPTLLERALLQINAKH